MGIFGKESNKDFSELHNDNIFNDDDDILLPRGQKPRPRRVGNMGIHAPHAITADELSGNFNDSGFGTNVQADSVYKRMKEREPKITPTAIDDDYVPSWASAPKEDNTAEVKQAEKNIDDIISSRPVVPTEKADTKETNSVINDAFLERCRIAVEQATSSTIEPIKPKAIPMSNSKDTESQPKVNETAEAAEKIETHSVDDIIKMLRGNNAESKPKENIECDEEVQQDASKEIKVEIEVIPTDSDSDIMHTTVANTALESDVRIYGKIKNGNVVGHTTDGESLEAADFIKASRATEDTIVVDDKTIMFGDLGDAIAKKAESDYYSDENEYDDEFDDYFDERPYYETNPSELDGVDDYKDLNDAARLKTKLVSEKSKNKTVSIFTLIITALMLIVSILPNGMLPIITVASVELILLAAAVVINYDIFCDFKNFKNLNLKFDTCVATASVIMLIQSIVSTFAYNGEFTGFSCAAAMLLLINRFAHFMKSSRVLNGLDMISNSDEKRAVLSVGGNNAHTISSGAVEGEALVLCDRNVVNIQDYLKNCAYDSPFDLRVKTLFIASATFGVVAGLIAGYFGGIGLGLTVTAALLCCLWPASAALICELPMYIAARKIAQYGAMISGYKGAYDLNLANLVAVGSSDLFPNGSVKLYNMKTLGENEIGKTLIDAAAIAIAAKSPLSSIFTEILGNGESQPLPKVTGVQYEDKMGICGWIGERTVLIGNRNIMQGHNIAVPPASVDQKILRAGYFPVYIAVDGIPCLLLIVKYETDDNVAHELQVLCNTGMTVVVDPNDPNASNAMICDYFGLPDDALKVMNHNGRLSYKRTTSKVESASAPAVFGKNVCGFFSAITSAIKLNGAYALLTAISVISAVLAAVLLIYLAVAGSFTAINALSIFLFQAVFTLASAIIAKIRMS